MRYLLVADKVTFEQVAGFSQHSVHAAQTRSKKMPGDQFRPDLVYVLTNALVGKQWAGNELGDKPGAPRHKDLFTRDEDQWTGFTVPRKRLVFFSWIQNGLDAFDSEQVAVAKLMHDGTFLVDVYSCKQDQPGAYLAAWSELGVKLDARQCSDGVWG
jgi:hypothetical protein